MRSSLNSLSTSAPIVWSAAGDCGCKSIIRPYKTNPKVPYLQHALPARPNKQTDPDRSWPRIPIRHRNCARTKRIQNALILNTPCPGCHPGNPLDPAPASDQRGAPKRRICQTNPKLLYYQDASPQTARLMNSLEANTALTTGIWLGSVTFKTPLHMVPLPPPPCSRPLLR